MQKTSVGSGKTESLIEYPQKELSSNCWVGIMLSHSGVSISLGCALSGQGCCRSWIGCLHPDLGDKLSSSSSTAMEGLRDNGSFCLLPHLNFFFLYLMLYLGKERIPRYERYRQIVAWKLSCIFSKAKENDKILVGGRLAEMCWDLFLPRSLIICWVGKGCFNLIFCWENFQTYSKVNITMNTHIPIA